MARLGIHKKGHGLEKLLGQAVAHKKPKDLHTGDQMEPHPMTSEVPPDIASLAGPDMSNQASTAGAPYMGGNSVDSSGTTAAAGFKKGGRVHYNKGSGLQPIGNLKLPRKIRSGLEMLKDGGSSKKWIQSAIKKPGSLKASLHVKEGEKIPAKKLASAAKKSGITGKRARLAQTLRSFKK
jgi:hypothetical protein